ncbi:hypothetical protein G6F37_001511 [Rhizopus arrhizus]|nr:hypothetical protein G6F38_006601 [Rhizopus arrhizus]KAG1163116.1 hypothetical protein G6F37_001511 [Rhizopus arrhizus]
MEAIIRNAVRQMDVEKEERATGAEIPVEISDALANTPPHHLQENFRKFKIETQRYALDEWITPEKINKTILPYLKRHSTETTMVVNTIYKITDNTRFQARVAMEIFEQLQYVLEEAANQAEAKTIIEKCTEQSKRLAIFGLATAKAQEREAKEYSDKALNIPISIKHLESTEDDSKTKNAYSDEFLTKFHQATFEQKLVQQASGNRGSSRRNEFGSRENQREGRGFRYGRGYGLRGSFFGQGTPQRWENQQNSYTSNFHHNQQPHLQHLQQPITYTANYSIPTDGIAPEGRLHRFVQQWQSITRHPWPLSVVKEGYQIPLVKKPTPWKLRRINLNQIEQSAVNEAVEKFLLAGIIEISPTQSKDYLSNFFTIQEATKRRPILDCQQINNYIQCHYFKMEGVPALREMIEQNDFICKLNLKDAYVVTPIHPNSKKYLTFQNQGIVYQYKTLAFGMSVSPRVFSKIMRFAIEPLRQQGIRLVYYLNDICVLGSTAEETKNHTQKVLTHSVKYLRVVINGLFDLWRSKRLNDSNDEGWLRSNFYSFIWDRAFLFDETFFVKRAECYSAVIKKLQGQNEDIAQQRVDFILRSNHDGSDYLTSEEKPTDEEASYDINKGKKMQQHMLKLWSNWLGSRELVGELEAMTCQWQKTKLTVFGTRMLPSGKFIFYKKATAVISPTATHYAAAARLLQIVLSVKRLVTLNHMKLMTMVQAIDEYSNENLDLTISTDQP